MTPQEKYDQIIDAVHPPGGAALSEAALFYRSRCWEKEDEVLGLRAEVERLRGILGEK